MSKPRLQMVKRELSHNDRMLQHPSYESSPGSWERHRAAITQPKGPEVAIVGMLKGWTAYADAHRARYESGIGEDYALGPQWALIGVALRALLNGDCGRLNCGAINANLLESLEAEGFDENGKTKL